MIKSVKQFFGPVVETVPSPEPPELAQSGQQQEVEADDIPRINFRLKGRLIAMCIDQSLTTLNTASPNVGTLS